MLGTPDKQVWPDGYKLAQVRRVKFPEYPRTALDKLMPHASSEAIEVMDGLMMWNPDQRLTAAQCLAHKYFVNERERHEAKERERAREKERERRERRERERAEGDAREEARDKERRPRERSDRGHKAHDTERSLKAQASSNNDDALSTAAPSLLPSVRPTARDRFPEGHVASRQPGPSSLVDAPPRHAGGGATERWRSDATNTEMSRSVTKNQQETAQDLRSDLPAPSVAGGGYAHGALHGVRKRRDPLHGHGIGGGDGHAVGSSVYRGALEEELEGTQQLLGRIRGNRLRKHDLKSLDSSRDVHGEGPRAAERDYSSMAGGMHPGRHARDSLRDSGVARSYLGGGLGGRGNAGHIGASPYALAAGPRQQPAAVARALGLNSSFHQSTQSVSVRASTCVPRGARACARACDLYRNRAPCTGLYLDDGPDRKLHACLVWAPVLWVKLSHWLSNVASSRPASCGTQPSLTCHPTAMCHLFPGQGQHAASHRRRICSRQRSHARQVGGLQGRIWRRGA